MKKAILYLCLFGLLVIPGKWIQAQAPGWMYAVPVTVTSTFASTETNVAVELTIDTQTPIGLGRLKSDASDLRFSLQCTDTTFLDHFITDSLNTTVTKVLVKIPSLPGNGSVQVFMTYGNPSANNVSSLSVFSGPHSSTDSVIPSNTGGVANSMRSFKFSANVPILVTHFGKREPTGTPRFIALWDVNTQSKVYEDTVAGPMGVYSYNQLANPILISPGTDYLFSMFQGSGDGYYYGSTSQIGQHLTYKNMFYCNSCNSTTYPSQTLAGYQYGVPDFLYYVPVYPSSTPTFQIGQLLMANAGSDLGACEGASVQLNGSATGGSGAYSYAWVPSTGLDSASLSNPMATLDSSSAYSLVVTDTNGCNSSDTVNLVMNPSPMKPSLGPDTGACGSISLVLDAGAGYSGYTWSTGDTTQTTNANAAGSYSVSVVDSNGCSAGDTLDLMIYAIPVVDLGPDTSVCPGTPIDLSATANMASYNWSTGATSMVLSVSVEGTYWVEITDANGCMASDTVVVDTCQLASIYGTNMSGVVFEVFPNPFQEQTTVKLSLPGTLNGGVYLYDLSGKVVFTDRRNAWTKGSHEIKISGNNLAPGVYNLEFRTTEGRLITKLVLNK